VAFYKTSCGSLYDDMACDDVGDDMVGWNVDMWH